MYPSVERIITISTGSVLLTKTGLLNHECAMTAKSLWNEATTQEGVSEVIWVDSRRWVRSDNIFTASVLGRRLPWTPVMLSLLISVASGSLIFTRWGWSASHRVIRHELFASFVLNRVAHPHRSIHLATLRWPHYFQCSTIRSIPFSFPFLKTYST